MSSVRTYGINLAERLCESLAIRLVRRPGVAKTIRQVLLQQYVVFGDEARVTIATSARINNALLNVVSGRIIIEDNAMFGHNVSLLTGSNRTAARGNMPLNATPFYVRGLLIRS